MKKRRQHHVWKAYLRAWATDERLWVLQNAEIRKAHIDDVAVQRDFYKLNALTRTDVEFIRKMWIEPSPPHSRRVHENYLVMFSAWATIRESLAADVAAANPEYVRFLDEQIVNAEEDFHSGFETRVAPLIDAARNGDVTFYEDADNAMLFAHFLSLQHFRTSGIKARVIERIKTRQGIDISRYWNIASHIMATNVGCSIFLERRRRPLILLTNDTTIPFITSDQPTANLLGGPSDERGPDHLSFYYPVSPKFAVLLDEPDTPSGIGMSPLSEAQVMQLNATACRMSNRQIFGSTEGVLSAIARVAA